MSAPDIPAELLPTGRLRAAILRTSPVLAARDPVSGALSGIAVDLARELGTRIGVPVDIIGYDTTAGLLDDLHARAGWDIGFFSHDPEHKGVSFSAPYLECEGTYLVMDAAPLRTVADVDRDGVRIAVSARSSLDLHLSRHLRHAALERIPGAEAAAEIFRAGKTNALAGIKQQLVRVAAQVPGSRLLEGRFVVIRHALASPAGRDAGAAYLRGFIEHAKASGLIAQLIRKHGIQGALVAPAGQGVGN
jgi:polar amino acid transport system substrate-binding protein